MAEDRKPEQNKNQSRSQGASGRGPTSKKRSNRRRRRKPRSPDADGASAKESKPSDGQRKKTGDSKDKPKAGSNRSQASKAAESKPGSSGARTKRSTTSSTTNGSAKRRRRRRGGKAQSNKKRSKTSVQSPANSQRKMVQKTIQQINRERSLGRDSDGKVDPYAELYLADMQGRLDPFMATLPFRAKSASRDQIPDAQKPVLFLFASREQALAQLEKIKNASEGVHPVRVVIESEGSREIAELEELAKVYTGASWFENHRRRAEAGYYEAVFHLA